MRTSHNKGDTGSGRQEEYGDVVVDNYKRMDVCRVGVTISSSSKRVKVDADILELKAQRKRRE
jgi:hypothetical protein